MNEHVTFPLSLSLQLQVVRFSAIFHQWNQGLNNFPSRLNTSGAFRFIHQNTKAALLTRVLKHWFVCKFIYE